MSFRRRSRRCAAIAVAALGLAVPAAQARPIDPPLGHGGKVHATHARALSPADARHFGIVLRRHGTTSGVTTAPASAPVVKVQQAGSGLDWGSIGLGAAGFFAIVAAFAGANAALARRRRVAVR